MHQAHGRHAKKSLAQKNHNDKLMSVNPCHRKGRLMTTELKTIVDQLGALKAQIAELTKTEKALADQLKASGYAEIDGDLFRAAIVWTERVTLNSDRVREVLSADDIAYCEQKAEVMSVRVSARKKAVA